MFALLSGRFRRWVLLLVGLPVLAWLLGRVAEEIEHKRGRSNLTDAMKQGKSAILGRTPGPVAKRLSDDDRRD